MNTEQERADFEAWYRLHHGSLDVYGRDASGEYADKQVQGAFNVWQARATLAAQKEDDARAAMLAVIDRSDWRTAANRAELRAMLAAAPAKPAAQDQGEVQRLREALETIAAYPYSRDQEMGATAMRKVARDALAAQPAASTEPVAWVAADTLNSPHPTCVSSLAYMSQIDKDRSREYVPLYAAPDAAQAPQPSLMDGATYRCRKCGEQNEIMLNSARIVTRLQDGSPRDPRDVESDPAGTLIHDPAKPLHAAQAPQGDSPADIMPPPRIHAAVHYAGWLRREAHRHQEPKASVLRQTARMLDVLQAECARLHQELIDAQASGQAPAAAGDALDAERYRWLRTRWGRIAEAYDGDSDQLVAIREADSHFEGWDVDPLSLDRAIDAALAGKGATK